MFRFVLIAAALTISACTPPPVKTNLANRNVAMSATPCENPAQRRCVFVNGPVAFNANPIRLLMRKQPYYNIEKSLGFIDSQTRSWTAPSETLTDGASIPTLFVPLVGEPKSPEFVNAATIHDAYCGAGNTSLPQYHSQPWQDVHRMFYDALRVGGTPATKAKIMFAAVYLGGPRWYTAGAAQPPANSGLTTAQFNQTITNNVPNWMLIAELEAAIVYIETYDPTIPEIEAFFNFRHIKMLNRVAASGPDGNPQPSNEPYGGYQQ